MAPTLYMTSASPPCRAVVMCAKSINLNMEIMNVDLAKGEHLKPHFLKKNPQHTVPLLEEEDENFLLPDSHAIMGYLVGEYSSFDDSLYPSGDNKKKALIDHRLHFDSSILYARGVNIVGPLIREDQQPSKESVESLKEAFAVLEKMLQGKQYMVGDSLTIADFSIYTTVTAWDAIVPISGFPNIKKYVDKLSKQQHFNSPVNVDGNKAIKSLISSKLQL